MNAIARLHATQVREALRRPTARQRHDRALELRISISAGRLERLMVTQAMREAEARAVAK